ncbi:uncharacterized protein [Vicugna pacos]|uniref:Uncharacterized protein n=1 Tax=Vicugna pacos TaxID=30538 RepID=A0ABM5BWR1_VICPA
MSLETLNPPRRPSPLGPPGPDQFHSDPLATFPAAGPPAPGSALLAGGGGARTHAQMRLHRRRNCPEPGEVGRSCSGSRGRRRSGHWAVACRRLLCGRRAGPIGSARPHSPHHGQQEPQPLGPRTHARMRLRRRRNCPELGEAGRSCSGSRGRRQSGDWAAACSHLRCAAGQLVSGFEEVNAALGGGRAPDAAWSTSDQPSGHGLLWLGGCSAVAGLRWDGGCACQRLDLLPIPSRPGAASASPYSRGARLAVSLLLGGETLLSGCGAAAGSGSVRR